MRLIATTAAAVVAALAASTSMADSHIDAQRPKGARGSRLGRPRDWRSGIGPVSHGELEGAEMTDKKQTKPPPPPPKRHKGGAVMRIITAALLAATVSALVPAAGPIVPTPEWRVTESARAGAERDYRFLEENCPSLFGRYGGDVESVEIYAPAMYFPANVPATSIRVKLREDLKRVPATLRAWGHALEYFVRSDGISVQKDQSWQVCNWSAVAPSGTTPSILCEIVRITRGAGDRGKRSYGAIVHGHSWSL